MHCRSIILALAAMTACAGPPARDRVVVETPRPVASRNAAHTASAMVGVPYRYGGSSKDGVDCSGLVVYSYARAGVSDLPHSVARLEHLARPVALKEIQPGDLLFFRSSGKKTSHVAIYVGDRAFVHAPSGGKQVERVSFDHIYWGPRIRSAGRLTAL